MKASKLMFGRIPVAGEVINAGAAASVTEALGWIMAKRFESQRCT